MQPARGGWLPWTVLGNYGSLDLFAAVDLGLSSLKSGRSPSTSTRSKPILDQVQVRSVHRLILPEMSRLGNEPSLAELEVCSVRTSQADNPARLGSSIPEPSWTRTRLRHVLAQLDS